MSRLGSHGRLFSSMTGGETSSTLPKERPNYSLAGDRQRTILPPIRKDAARIPEAAPTFRELFGNNNTNSTYKYGGGNETRNNSNRAISHKPDGVFAPRMIDTSERRSKSLPSAMSRLITTHQPETVLPEFPAILEKPEHSAFELHSGRRRNPRVAHCFTATFLLIIVLIIEILFIVFGFPVDVCTDIRLFVIIVAVLACFVAIFDWGTRWMIYEPSPMAKKRMYPSTVSANNEILEMEVAALSSPNYSRLARPELTCHNINDLEIGKTNHRVGGGFKGRTAPKRVAEVASIRSTCHLTIVYAIAILVLIFGVFWVVQHFWERDRHVIQFNFFNQSKFVQVANCTSWDVIYGLKFILANSLFIIVRACAGCCRFIDKVHRAKPLRRTTTKSSNEAVPVVVSMNNLEAPATTPNGILWRK